MLYGIVGAGLSGSVIYSLLKREGFNINIYEPLLVRGCKSSLFFMNKKEYRLITYSLKKCGIDFKDYVTNEINEIQVEDIITNPKKKIFCVDKSKLLEDLVPRTVIIHREVSLASNKYVTKLLDGKIVRETTTKSDLDEPVLIDASGAAKILIPKSNKYEQTIRTCQFLVKSLKNIDRVIFDNIKIKKGYNIVNHYRIYPVSNGLYHICTMQYENDEIKLWKDLEDYGYEKLGKFERICGCTFKISGNLIDNGFICGKYKNRYIFGVGESIGLTDCFGNGNTYAIISSFLLYRALKKYELEKALIAYKKEILKMSKYLDVEKKSISNFNIFTISKILQYYFNIPFTSTAKILVKSVI
ncbi:NAD(P)-binding protein [Methanocaldococcus indicus]|uniref:NAD(P)-binding protein n=1 Tax=Methanocaldococcus indicus TaxID=213231 RepID=UPI003C6CEAB3